jgi:hypothetical protein
MVLKVSNTQTCSSAVQGFSYRLVVERYVAIDWTRRRVRDRLWIRRRVQSKQNSLAFAASMPHFIGEVRTRGTMRAVEFPTQS